MDVSSIILIVVQVAAVVVSCVSLVCFFHVFMAMRQNGDTTLATICLVTLLFLGVGAAVAFLHGVAKSREWELDRVMMLWGSCLALLLLLWGAALALPT